MEEKLLRKWYKKKSIVISDLYECDERYQRYLNLIVCWTDTEGNDYTYIQEKIYEFVSLVNNNDTIKYKFDLMKYIDGEIILMMNLCLMKDMEV